MRDGCGIGAGAGTNNTGELMGVLRALRWAAQPEWKGRDVVICYDSKYSAQQARGVWKAKKNVELIKRVQGALRDAEDGGVRVWWRWVKGTVGRSGTKGRIGWQTWGRRYEMDRVATAGGRIPVCCRRRRARRDSRRYTMGSGCGGSHTSSRMHGG